MKSTRLSRASFPRLFLLSAAALWSLTRLMCLVSIFFTASAWAERELHVIGVYEGTNGTTHGEVLVNRPGQNVTLFLSAYDSIDWQITVGGGTTIERVFLSGYYHQSVQGIPASTPVIENVFSEGGSYLFVGYTLGSSRMLRSVPVVNEITGQEISSFHGSYQAPATPFVVDAVQDEPLLSADYPQPVPLSELPDLHFKVATYDPTRITLHDYTLAGPTDGGPLIPESQRMSADAAGRFYYGGNDGLIAFDTQTGTAQIIPLPEHISREGWQMGTAFDRTRNRALLVTLAGEGFLYSFTPATQQWGVVSSMQNRDFDCLEYHDADDSVYGVTLSHEDTYYSKVVGLSAGDGSFRKEIALPIFPFDIDPFGHLSELVSVGDYLVLLLQPRNWYYYPGRGLPEARIYLIDPRTGEVWLTYREKGPPNRPPNVAIVSPANGKSVAPSSVVRLTASAFDPDGSVASVEFHVDGASVGFGALDINGRYALNWTAPASGDHEIVAYAKDNRGAIGASDSVTIRVNRSPQVQMTAPANGAAFVKSSIVQLVARAEDADGSISKVEFIVDGSIAGVGARMTGTNDFSLAWVARDPGAHSIVARAVDDAGASTTSAAIQITVTSEASKAVRLLPAQYQPGRRFRVGILASPVRGTISYTIIERPPVGWSVGGISNGGAFDAASGVITFGPFESDRIRLLTYWLKPPAKAKGVQLFSGEIVADGVSSPIGGKQTIGGPRSKRQTLRNVLLR